MKTIKVMRGAVTHEIAVEIKSKGIHLNFIRHNGSFSTLYEWNQELENYFLLNDISIF